MKRVFIPVATDVACAKAFDENAEAEIKNVADVQDDDMIFDLGPDSTAALAEIIGNAKTILWNGPVGVFSSRTSKLVLKAFQKLSQLCRFLCCRRW